MAKVTQLGLVPKDDPMFSSGPQMFSAQRFQPSTSPTEPNVDEAAAGDSQQSPSADPLQPFLDSNMKLFAAKPDPEAPEDGGQSAP